jgi:hypothetical protein
MIAVVTRCCQSGQEFEPTHSTIVAGAWRTCPACSPVTVERHQCRECGRPLRTAGRAICLSCLRAAAL